MLIELCIDNYTIVKHCRLELQPNMTVITGETGAGKSIMIDALELCLGARSDARFVRPDSNKCEITASFSIENNMPALQWLKTNDFFNNAHDSLILRRIISKEGRSKAYINGSAATLTQLQHIAEHLVTIHGQHEQQYLLKRDTHRKLLDNFAKHHSLIQKVKQAYQAYTEISVQLLKIDTQQDAVDRLALLQYQTAELNDLALQTGEYEKLLKEHKRLTHAEQTLEDLQSIIQNLDSDEKSVQMILAQSLNQLNTIVTIAPELKNTQDLIKQAEVCIREAIPELNHYFDQLEHNPERLRGVENRLDIIHALARKHQCQPDALAQRHQQLLKEIQQLEQHDQFKIELQQQLVELEKNYLSHAQTLSQSRAKSAKLLSKKITTDIQKLGMPAGVFQVQCLKNTEAFSMHGLESIEFHVAINPGQRLQALAKVASGGEMSRISLAIQVATIGNAHHVTLFFDEVDVGIGGGTAEIVGRLLHRLGTQGQVICVTHLPQVAAQGQHHFYVEKQLGNDSTQTEVISLNEKQRINEIARMLGGVNITKQTMAHAQEMLNCFADT